MKNKILSIIIMLIFILNTLPIVYAAPICNPEVDKYELTNLSGMNINVMEINETGKLVVYIVDDMIKTSQISSVSNIDVSALDGCFSAENPDSIEITSTGSSPAEYKLIYNKVTYKGIGKTITFTIEYTDLKLMSEKIVLTISQVSEIETDSEIPAANKSPYIEVITSNITEPVKKNTDFNITFNIKNRGGAKMKRGIITFDTPNSIYYIGMSKIQLPDINAGSNRNLTLKFKTADILKSSSEAVDFTIDYEYDSNGQNQSSSYSGKVYVPLDYSSGNNKPVVKITRDNFTEPVKAGQNFALNVIVKNIGDSDMYSPLVSFSYPDGLTSLEDNSNIELSNLKPNEEKKLTLDLKAPNRLSSSSLEISADVSYSYKSDYGMEQTTSSSKLTIPVLYENKGKPILKITRDGFTNVIKAGQTFELGVNIKNLGSTKAISPLVSISCPDGIIPLEDNSNIELSDIASGEEKKISMKFKASPSFTSISADITAEVKYSYDGENGIEQNTDSSKIIIPFAENNSQGDPLLQTEINNISKPLNANENFSVSASITNIGNTDIDTSVLSWEASDGIMLTGKTASVNVGKIKAGETRTVVVNGKTSSEIPSSLTITGTLKYKYMKENAVAQSDDTIKIVLPAVANKDSKLKSATPKIVVKNYSYGGVPAAIGRKFDFSVEFMNTSDTMPVENIVMSVEPENGVSITSSSNTYYYEKLTPNEKLNQTLNMQVLPNAENSSVTFNIKFNYEYVENNSRENVDMVQSVSVPIYKPDKLEITLKPLAPATVGYEQSVTLEYVNKGMGTLSNVKAEIIGDVNTLTSVQNLGNYESGKSGTINFIVIPEEAGETEFTVRVSYEDANYEEKTLDFPCVMTAENEQEFSDEVLDMEPEKESNGIPIVKIICIAIGVIAAVIIAIIIIKKVKKNKKKGKNYKVNWEEQE